MKHFTIILSYFFSVYLYTTYQNSFTILQKQENNTWKTLGMVKTEKKTDNTGKYMVETPVFSSQIMLLQHKEIVLKGYIIPLQELRKQNYFVLSRYPYSLCYFCGAAGIETVVEVHTQEDIKFTESAITLRGILEINPKNPNQLLYILQKATVVK